MTPRDYLYPESTRVCRLNRLLFWEIQFIWSHKHPFGSDNFWTLKNCFHLLFVLLKKKKKTTADLSWWLLHVRLTQKEIFLGRIDSGNDGWSEAVASLVVFIQRYGSWIRDSGKWLWLSNVTWMWNSYVLPSHVESLQCTQRACNQLRISEWRKWEEKKEPSAAFQFFADVCFVPQKQMSSAHFWTSIADCEHMCRMTSRWTQMSLGKDVRSGYRIGQLNLGQTVNSFEFHRVSGSLSWFLSWSDIWFWPIEHFDDILVQTGGTCVWVWVGIFSHCTEEYVAGRHNNMPLLCSLIYLLSSWARVMYWTGRKMF